MTEIIDKHYWNNRWQTQQIQWDLGQVSPPIKTYLEQYNNKQAAILIPGCGNAYEALFLAEQGFTNITLLDIVPQVIADLHNKFQNNPQVKIICDDFFTHNGAYDLILEQTFFCALQPEMRLNYVKKMHQLLKNNGRLVGVLFTKNFNNPFPPFGGDSAEYKLLFEPYFTFHKFESCYNSIKPRNNFELFINLIKK
ncbi:methyltransferase domain-containing protein [Flavobacterium agricola]|uniref:Methyltransferase domain-containing protein n=1 Tax=Flavobacterium agricola TaxID=2870839 RepID=A0ABY6M433_9FLAO|nr:TPMT family class I SAM-dependent methyltransferase [Flavobacterium agricola]UYW02293.1 methyltransferase domain-containing protein [Flavobacterium agricola]